MIDYMFRLKSIEIRDFMNIEYGHIEFPLKKYHSKDMGMDIVGIYGQNGSGKSSVVKALSLLKYIYRTYDYEIHDYARCITVGKDCSKFAYEFDYCNFQDVAKCSLSLEFSIREKKFSDGRVGIEVFNERIGIIDKLDDGISPANFYIGERTPVKDLDSFLSFFYPRKNTDERDKLRNQLVECRKKAKENELATFGVIAEDSIIMSGFSLKGIVPGFSEKRAFLIRCVLRYFIEGYLFSEVFVYGDKEEGNGRIKNLHFPLDLCCIQKKEYRHKEKGEVEIDSVTGEISISNAIDLSLYINTLKITVDKISEFVSCLIPGVSFFIVEQDDSIRLMSRHDELNIPFYNESYGIRKMFELSLYLIHAFNYPRSLIIIDEFDEGIFEFAFGELLTVLNKEGVAQILFTAHNLRALETLDKRRIFFSTSDPKNRFCNLKYVKPSHNLRDVYLRKLYMPDSEHEYEQYLYSGKSRYSIEFALENAWDGDEYEE